MVLPANASRWATSPALGLLHQLGDFLVGALGAADQPAIAGVHPAVVQPDFRAVLDLLEDVGSRLVDEGDAVGHQHFWAQVGIPARHRRGCVDHGGDLGVDERIGGDPVKVQHIEDDDVAGAHPPQQSVDVAVDPGGADNTRPRGVTTGQKRSHPRGHTHGGDSVGEGEVRAGRRAVTTASEVISCHTCHTFECRHEVAIRSQSAASSSSRAWARAVSDSPSPASILANSATRSSPSRRRTPLAPFFPVLSTMRCTSA